MCVLQDYCGGLQNNGTFRVITENVPCGTTGTTCSKTIKIFLGVNLTLLQCKHFKKVILCAKPKTGPAVIKLHNHYILEDTTDIGKEKTSEVLS